MLGFLALLPAYALDLEVTYTAESGHYTRSWTFHDVDLGAPDVVVACPGGEVCRVSVEVQRLEAGAPDPQVTVALRLQTLPEGRKAARLISAPRITMLVGQEGVFEQSGGGQKIRFTVLPFEPEEQAPEPE